MKLAACPAKLDPREWREFLKLVDHHQWLAAEKQRQAAARKRIEPWQ